MTSDQSRKLKIGTLVCFNGDQADRGAVTAIHTNYVHDKMGRWPSEHFEPQRYEASWIVDRKTMTGDKSRQLKVGDRICWGDH